MFEVSQLTMKFERHLDSEIVQMQFLSENFHKLVKKCFLLFAPIFVFPISGIAES